MIDLQQLKSVTKDIRVLYVEDELDIQAKMLRYLEKFFSYVKVANDGLDGLDTYKTEDFDIVITDLSMPKMSGMEMIQEIKKLDESQSILITSAHDESSYLLAAISAHVDGYILKPFDFDALNHELFKISEKIVLIKENYKYKTYLQEMLKQQTFEMNENYEKTLYSLVDLIEQRDTYTAGHSKRVAHYCELMAKDMGYSDEECIMIHQAAILHDIGKIETPDSVLLNPKKLNDLEYTLIQEHVNVGHKILSNIPMFNNFAPIVHSHHEKYDGSGYPNGLKGEEINEFARIMIVADAFDAMTTNRIYKGRKTVNEAIEELEYLSKVQFHPEVVSSAKRVLKDITLDASINQLPKTKLEKERFAYFYNDPLTQAYNQNYLDVVLLKNGYEMFYESMVIFSIEKFSLYNKKHTWEEGDNVLKEFTAILKIHLDEQLVFRIFGDDFVVMGEEEIDITGVKKVLDEFMQKHSLNYRINRIDLKSQKISKLSEIEILQAKE